VARFLTTVESVAALPATAPSGASANALFGNLVAGANAGYKLRRITLGVRAGASVPTSQQLTVAIVRATARGTATTTNAPKAMDPNSLQTSSIIGMDAAWSTVPTATWTAPYFWEESFNSQSGLDLPYELIEELICPVGTANGLAFLNVGNALPTGHIYTLTCESDE
jgi:hypothetical protein